MINTAKRLEGIGEYYFSQKLREIEQMNREQPRVINLGIGSPDLPPHDSVIAALQEAAAHPGHHAYQSYKGIPALRTAMAQWYAQHYGVVLDPQTEILPLMGSKEGIMHICMTYLQTGDEALVPDPGYPAYATAAKLSGAQAVTYALRAENNWQPDWQQLEARDTSRVKIFFANYPHMPSGQLPDAALFERLVDFCRQRNILLVHDNPYSFILTEKPMSIFSVPGAKETAVELNSLSKAHNMAGWRVGMLIGASQIINEVLGFKSNMDSGMFLPVQLAAAEALTKLPKEWYQSLNAVYQQRKWVAMEILDALGCRYAGKQAGLFVWARVPEQYPDAYALSDEVLKRKRVFITPGGIFGNEGRPYLRISLCQPETIMHEALKRIKA
jgi:LL-diaminopimelate aminotransferase